MEETNGRDAEHKGEKWNLCRMRQIVVWTHHGKKQVDVVTRQLYYDKKQLEPVTYDTFWREKLDTVADTSLYDN